MTIGCHGAHRHAQNTDRALIDAAKRKVSKYRLDYLQQDTVFLPLISSTSGRLHVEFVWFLCFLALRRAIRVGIASRALKLARFAWVPGAAPPRRRAPTQGAWVDALPDDDAAQWGG